MIVPEFWAEGRVQHKVPGRQVTVKRFGWSDTSAEDAQSMADALREEIIARHAVHRRRGEKPSAQALQRIEKFGTAHHDWHLRVYQTPAGLRVLAMHDVFDASPPQASEIFQDLGADPVYVRMCQNQRCFRARVSPKPWRIGISQHIRPRPGYWPVKPQHLPHRRQWVEAYEEKGALYASCLCLRTFGSSRVRPAAEAVRHLHDELSRAHASLPLA